MGLRLPMACALWLGVACTPVEPAISSTADAHEASGDGGVAAQNSVVELDVPGHHPATVVVPQTDDPRPLVIGAHGSYGRAEWFCDLWRRIVGTRGFVLCPQGRRVDQRVAHVNAVYYFADHRALDAELHAATAALRARFGGRVDTDAALFSGFSQGAIHGAFIITADPQRFPRAVLVEGGNGFFDEWSAYSARRYRAGGGERVLFACGSIWCVRSAERCAGYLDGAGVATRVLHAEGVGHSYGGAMERELQESFDWVVRGDARWQSQRPVSSH